MLKLHSPSASKRTSALSAKQKPRPKSWLTLGNAKVGAWTPTFNLLPGDPAEVAGGTCPGASAWCGQRCYARRGRQAWPSVRNRYASNFQRIQEEGLDAFVKGVVAEIRGRAVGIVRLHAAGDFFGEAYADAWVRIVRACPHTRFWAYTRSYRVPALLPHLERLHALPNMQLFASIDPSMPIVNPDAQDLAARYGAPLGWRVALLTTQIEPGTSPLVCPQQVGKMPSCAACQFCFSRTPGESETQGHVAFIPH